VLESISVATSLDLPRKKVAMMQKGNVRQKWNKTLTKSYTWCHRERALAHKRKSQEWFHASGKVKVLKKGRRSKEMG
jgi:hypothetical protein